MRISQINEAIIISVLFISCIYHKYFCDNLSDFFKLISDVINYSLIINLLKIIIQFIYLF